MVFFLHWPVCSGTPIVKRVEGGGERKEGPCIEPLGEGRKGRGMPRGEGFTSEKYT